MKRRDQFLIVSLVLAFAVVVYISFQQSIIEKNTEIYEEPAEFVEE